MSTKKHNTTQHSTTCDLFNGQNLGPHASCLAGALWASSGLCDPTGSLRTSRALCCRPACNSGSRSGLDHHHRHNTPPPPPRRGGSLPAHASVRLVQRTSTDKVWGAAGARPLCLGSRCGPRFPFHRTVNYKCSFLLQLHNALLKEICIYYILALLNCDIMYIIYLYFYTLYIYLYLQTYTQSCSIVKQSNVGGSTICWSSFSRGTFLVLWS